MNEAAAKSLLADLEALALSSAATGTRPANDPYVALDYERRRPTPQLPMDEDTLARLRGAGGI